MSVLNNNGKRKPVIRFDTVTEEVYISFTDEDIVENVTFPHDNRVTVHYDSNGNPVGVTITEYLESW